MGTPRTYDAAAALFPSFLLYVVVMITQYLRAIFKPHLMFPNIWSGWHILNKIVSSYSLPKTKIVSQISASCLRNFYTPAIPCYLAKTESVLPTSKVKWGCTNESQKSSKGIFSQKSLCKIFPWCFGSYCYCQPSLKRAQNKLKDGGCIAFFW